MALVSQFVNAGDLRASRTAGVRDQALLFQLGRELRDLDQQFQFNQSANPLRISKLEEELRASRFKNQFNDDTRDFQFNQSEAESELAAGRVDVQQDQIEVLGATQANRIEGSNLTVQQQRQQVATGAIDQQVRLAGLPAELQAAQIVPQASLDNINAERQLRGQPPLAPADVDELLATALPQIAQVLGLDAAQLGGALGGGLSGSPSINVDPVTGVPVPVNAGAAGSNPRAINDGTRVGAGRVQVNRVLGAAGMSPQVVAGFLGNFEVEGGYTGAVGDNGTAFGIAQWRGSRVRNFRRVIGKDPSRATVAEQAQFVLWEMNNPGAAGMTTGQRDAILAARTPEEAATLIDRFYERSSGEHRSRRASAARGFYNGGSAQTPASAARPSYNYPDFGRPTRAPARAPTPAARTPAARDPLGDFFAVTGTQRPLVQR